MWGVFLLFVVIEMISTANNIEAVFYNVTQLVIICSLICRNHLRHYPVIRYIAGDVQAPIISDISFIVFALSLSATKLRVKCTKLIILGFFSHFPK